MMFVRLCPGMLTVLLRVAQAGMLALSFRILVKSFKGPSLQIF